MFCTRPPQRRAAGSKLLSYPHTVPSFRRALSTPMAADIAARNVCTAGMALTSGRWMRCGRRMRCSEGALSGSQSQASALWAVRLNPQASGRSGISGSPSSLPQTSAGSPSLVLPQVSHWQHAQPVLTPSCRGQTPIACALLRQRLLFFVVQLSPAADDLSDRGLLSQRRRGSCAFEGRRRRADGGYAPRQLAGAPRTFRGQGGSLGGTHTGLMHMHMHMHLYLHVHMHVHVHVLACARALATCICKHGVTGGAGPSLPSDGRHKQLGRGG